MIQNTGRILSSLTPSGLALRRKERLREQHINHLDLAQGGESYFVS